MFPAKKRIFDFTESRLLKFVLQYRNFLIFFVFEHLAIYTFVHLWYNGYTQTNAFLLYGTKLWVVLKSKFENIELESGYLNSCPFTHGSDVTVNCCCGNMF